MRNFRDLRVWVRAHEFALWVYSITRDFPSEEKFGITSQLRRAATSVPTNIAEGCGHNSNQQFIRFLTIAQGSLSEVEYLLLLSKDLKYLKVENHDLSINEIRRMIQGLIEANKE